MAYDPTNIFARIIRGEIPCKKVYEDTHVLAFHDINPAAPTHILVVPKGPYESFDDFTASASPEEIAALFKAVGDIARNEGISGDGYRVISNCGANGNQEVPHLHIHLLGGRNIGPMVKRV